MRDADELLFAGDRRMKRPVDASYYSLLSSRGGEAFFGDPVFHLVQLSSVRERLGQ